MSLCLSGCDKPLKIMGGKYGGGWKCRFRDGENTVIDEHFKTQVDMWWVFAKPLAEEALNEDLGELTLLHFSSQVVGLR